MILSYVKVRQRLCGMLKAKLRLKWNQSTLLSIYFNLRNTWSTQDCKFFFNI